MSTTTKSLSASYVAERFGMTEKTSRLFMHKVREGMKPNGNHPMGGNVHVDEFIIGGKEEGKVGRSYNAKRKTVVCAVQLTDEGKVKRVLFHADRQLLVQRAQKEFYQPHLPQSHGDNRLLESPPLAIDYDITQIESDGGGRTSKRCTP